MKSYTDLEQSKRLAEFLSLESADMCWIDKPQIVTDCPKVPVIPDIELKAMLPQNKLLPCWSLAALLQILPLGIYDELDNCDYELEINMIDKMPRYVRLGDIYHSQFPYDFEKDTLLDNVVESIIWLSYNNYFEL